MIRVFLLAVLGLVALALVARNLPKYAMHGPVEAAASAARTVDESAPFARWEGSWEGEFISRHTDGTVIETTRVRQEYTSVSPLEQRVIIRDTHGSNPAIVSNGVNLSTAGGLECRVTDPNGLTKTLEGRREGSVIFWHRRDRTAGIEESFREEILTLPGGDLYTIDGFGIYGSGSGTVVLLEGRYRRVDQPGR